jgi:hypothetical protein
MPGVRLQVEPASRRCRTLNGPGAGHFLPRYSASLERTHSMAQENERKEKPAYEKPEVTTYSEEELALTIEAVGVTNPPAPA